MPAVPAGTVVTMSATEANTFYAKGSDTVKNVLNYATHRHSGEKIVSGTGTTVLNVYYVRTKFTYEFYLTPGRNRTGTVMKGDDIVTDARMIAGGKTYSMSDPVYSETRHYFAETLGGQEGEYTYTVGETTKNYNRIHIAATKWTDFRTS